MLSVGLWNRRDSILKVWGRQLETAAGSETRCTGGADAMLLLLLQERLFGLTGTEGNHGEDVKEYYWYLDATPTHSYMKMLYKYALASQFTRRVLI